MDEKLEYFKKKILAHLDDLEQKEVLIRQNQIFYLQRVELQFSTLNQK